MNIRMEYLDRDAGNYKSWGAVVVANAPNPLTPDEVEAGARAVLIDGGWFVASAAGLPDLRCDEWDDEHDHDWHELHGFSEMDELPDDPRGRDIRGLLGALAAGAAQSV